jgi:four helix bundle protein
VECLVLRSAGLNTKAEALQERTAAFAVAIIRLCETIRDSMATRTIKSQLIDAATSVAANYRAACRARSRAEFIAKIGLVREEADEAHGWLCMLVNIGAVKESAAPHIKEANELTNIFSASYLTARRRGKPKPHQ